MSGNTQSSDYPLDANLNACIIADKLFCNTMALDETVKKRLNEHIKIVHVNQGYAKCSVCIVDEASIITSDTGIAKAAENLGMNVLLISPGNIALDGYEYGFIGGASFKSSPRDIVFTGNLEKHPDKNRILDFLNARNINPLFLTDDMIFDVGSILPVTDHI